ncbi:hypothetical protein [Pinibacter soli]|uniref:Uncharacterized protein n=1 Tax=Pinibacter soli TaxID=3044211 RepID=A0ABT6RE76_9BACT|nr:hypothetical protein [Pinibacter soli]MDI3320700.1 hypothetical protein [Pinibacter soli]
MISLNSFKEFLYQQFDSKQIYFDEHSSDIHFYQIDCFADQPYKLAIEVCHDLVKIATVSKEPELDFSLYDYIFNDLKKAEELIIEVQKNGYKSPSKYSHK